MLKYLDVFSWLLFEKLADPRGRELGEDLSPLKNELFLSLQSEIMKIYLNV